MSKRGVGTPNSKIPDDPVWIEFPRSDGDRRTWPTHTTYVEDRDGQINWMKELPIDHPVALKWRLIVGNALALDMGRLPVEKAVLRDWPANYKMYDHHKGPARGNVRHDIYLYGPVSRRFRSPKEFVAHALWLCRDPTMDMDNCFCKYCKKVPQKVISGALDSIIQTPSQSASAPPLSQSSSNSHAGGPSTSTQVLSGGRDIYSTLQQQGWARRDRDRDGTSLAQRRAHREQRARQKAKPKGAAGEDVVPKIFAAIQKPLKPVHTLKLSENVLDMPMLAQRNRDLRAVYSRSANDKMGVLGWDDADRPMVNVGGGMAEPPDLVSQEDPSLRRWFRQGEVVWVQLPGGGVRLTEPGDPVLNITAWPAIVHESKVKNTPVPIAPANGSGYSSQPQGKQLDSVSIHQDTTLNGTPHTSSSDLPPISTLQSQQLPSTTSSLQAQPSTNISAASAIPSSTNVLAPAPFSNPRATATIASDRANEFSSSTAMGARPSTPLLPTRVGQPTNATPETESAAWTIRESTVYSVRLIGPDIKLDVPDRDVLPYLAHAPKQEIIDYLRAVPPETLHFDREAIGKYDPFEASTPQKDGPTTDEEAAQKARDAASAFSLGVQIAATLCGYWSLTDKWDFLYVPTGDGRMNVVSKSTSRDSERTEPSAPAPAFSSISAPPRMAPTVARPEADAGGLSSIIEAAARTNAASASSYSKKTNLNAAAGTGPVYQEISGTSDSMTEQEVRQVAATTLGVGALTDSEAGPSSGTANGNGGNGSRNSASGASTQVRFQGMWWGPERIWVDDFVRLKVGRAFLAPGGAPNVYQSSGWGKKNVEDWSNVAKLHEERLAMSATPPRADTSGKGKGRDMGLPYLPEIPAFQGANLRGVFMKIDGLFVVDVLKRDGRTKKEGRICGMLYELAELDWEETEPELMEQYEADMQQRGAHMERTGLNAAPAFQASVNESLLPSTSNGRGPASPSPLQSSPPSQYLIPQAPKGYRFRPILRVGYEAVLNLSLVSGRYYPRLLSHPILAPTIVGALTVGRRDGTLKQWNNLFALEGLCAGHFNAVDPTTYKKGRVAMVEDADRAAMKEMEDFKMQKASEWEHGEEAMEEDVEGQSATAPDELSLLEPMNVD